MGVESVAPPTWVEVVTVLTFGVLHVLAAAAAAAAVAVAAAVGAQCCHMDTSFALGVR
jgi:hypothetical protein